MEENSYIFDTIVIGAGPAGLSAAIYAARKSLKVLLIAKTIGGQAILSGDIENFLGFTRITGSDLASKFKQEVGRFKGRGIWVKEGFEVKKIEGRENNFSVLTDRGKFRGKTIIVASGRIPRMLGVPGENKFFGKGVATCATCDAPFYKDKDVVVVGGGNSALDAALSLLKIAKSVKIINITDDVRGDEMLIKNVKSAQNVEILNDCTVTEIFGKNLVEGVKVQNKQTHGESVFKTEGVFVEVGWTPSVDFIPQIAKNKNNEIMVDEFGKTSMPGIWAAGDVNNLWGEQIIIAAGEGAKVALSVSEHISKIPHQATSNIHMG